MGAERLIPLVLVAVLAAGCRSAGTEQLDTTEAAAEHGVVQRVGDGDSLMLRSGVQVRLLQIDAPELASDCYGRAAAKELVRLVPPGTRVNLVADTRLDDHDRYGRRLRYVFVGETNVNLELVRRGAASAYFFRNERGYYAGALERATRDARAARAGYWGECPRAELNPGIGSVTGHG